MPTTLTPQFYELIEADTKDIFFKEISMAEENWREVFDVKPSTKAYEDRMPVAGFGTLALKAEGTPVAFDSPVQGTKVRAVHSTYALGGRFTMEMMADDQHGIISQMPADLAASYMDHRARLVWGALDDGFAGSTYSDLYGQTLFNTAHTALRSEVSTQSNTLSPAVALSEAGIEAAITQARITRSNENRYQNVELKVLVVHPENEFEADKLMQTEKTVGSNNNDISMVATARTGIKVVSVPYLSSTTKWSLHAPPGKNGLCYYNRMDADYDSAVDSDTKDVKFYACYRGTPALNDWRGNHGSNA